MLNVVGQFAPCQFTRMIRPDAAGATLACQPPNGRSENRASAVAFRPAAVHMLVSAAD
jgi:hypothetical protein